MRGEIKIRIEVRGLREVESAKMRSHILCSKPLTSISTINPWAHLKWLPIVILLLKPGLKVVDYYDYGFL